MSSAAVTSSSAHDDPSPEDLESMRQQAYDRSKWLQTTTSEILKFELTQEELERFFDEFVDVIERLKCSAYHCHGCGKFPMKVGGVLIYLYSKC